MSTLKEFTEKVLSSDRTFLLEDGGIKNVKNGNECWIFKRCNQKLAR